MALRSRHYSYEGISTGPFLRPIIPSGSTRIVHPRQREVAPAQHSLQPQHLLVHRLFNRWPFSLPLKMRFSFITSALLLAVTSIASPVPVTEVEAVEVSELVARQSATTCGSTSYTASQVSAAVSKGYNYYQNDQQVGSNNYPHTVRLSTGAGRGWY